MLSVISQCSKLAQQTVVTKRSGEVGVYIRKRRGDRWMDVHLRWAEEQRTKRSIRLYKERVHVPSLQCLLIFAAWVPNARARAAPRRGDHEATMHDWAVSSSHPGPGCPNSFSFKRMERIAKRRRRDGPASLQRGVCKVELPLSSVMQCAPDTLVDRFWP